MSGSEIDRTLVRLAHELVDESDDIKNLAIVGILRRGAVLAERLAAKVSQIADGSASVGSLDINLYREDLSTVAEHPVVNGADLPISITGRDVVLVDDVLYTGRTIRAALNALLDRGQPLSVRLCVLIDRGHRALPIEAQFVGKHVETSDSEIVEVKVEPVDGEEKVLLAEKVSAA